MNVLSSETTPRQIVDFSLTGGAKILRRGPVAPLPPPLAPSLDRDCWLHTCKNLSGCCTIRGTVLFRKELISNMAAVYLTFKTQEID